MFLLFGQSAFLTGQGERIINNKVERSKLFASLYFVRRVEEEHGKMKERTKQNEKEGENKS